MTMTHQLSVTPWELLLQHCAMEATHQSATAEYTPKLKPGTWEQVIADIMQVLRKDDGGTTIIWFPGLAGGGKMCIQWEVAHLHRTHISMFCV